MVNISISSGIIVTAGAILSTVGLAGCAIFSITPSGTIGMHPVFTAIAVAGIVVVISSSFVEAGSTRKPRGPDNF